MTEPEAANYPQLFRAMIVRSAEATLASVDRHASSLDDHICERSHYALGFALSWPDAWSVACELLLLLSLPIGWQGYREEWTSFLEQGVEVAKREKDLGALPRLYVRLGWYYRSSGKFELSDHYSFLGYQTAQEQDDEAVQLDALNQLVAVASERSDYQAVQDYINKIFMIVPPGSLGRAHAYGALGFVELQHGHFDEAIEAYSLSFQMHLAAGNHRFAAQAEQGLAAVYGTARQCEQALVHYQHVVDAFSHYPSVLDLASAQMEMGVVYTYMHDYERALAMYQLCEPALVRLGSKPWLAHLYNNYGLAYTGKRCFEQAESCFRLSIRLSYELALPRHVANAMDSLGLMYQVAGDLDKAVATWQQAIEQLNFLPTPPLYLKQLLEKRLAEVCELQGNPISGSPEQASP